MKQIRILWILASLALCGCTASEGSAAKYNPGTYTGSGEGKNGEITVEVEVTENEIVSVRVVSEKETPAYADEVREKIPAMIVEAQSAQIDADSSATYTSQGIIDAAADALAKAAK